MKRSVEILSHFRCDGCDKWWTVGDAPADKKTWYCPWCAKLNTEPEDKKNEGDVPEWNSVADSLAALGEAAKEMEKLFGPFKDILKKK